MAASVKPQPRSVVDVFAKLAASGGPIPDVGNIPPWTGKDKPTIPSHLVLHIFRFAPTNVHANIAASCKTAYFHLKTSLTAGEILAAVGDQTKHYPIRAVVQKIIAYVKLFPNLRNLNCRDLQLKMDNRASRDLVPCLMRAWPRELRGITVPYNGAGSTEFTDPVKSFVSDLMEGIYQALPLSLVMLDLRVNLPAQVREHQAIDTLKIEQIDCSKVLSLGFSEGYQTSAVHTVFPQLRHLTVALQTGGQLPLISELIRNGKHLETLTIVNEAGSLRRLSLCLEGAKITQAHRPNLRRVEIVACVVNNTVVQFFKRVSPTLEVRFRDCRIELEDVSFTFTPQALQNYTKS